MSTHYSVSSDSEAQALLAEIEHFSLATGYPVGLDTETVGCDPGKESPVERARVWCLTLAWGTPRPFDAYDGPSDFDRAFIPREYLHHIKPWLEDHCAPKVGTNIFGFDRHVLRNEGIELRGIVGDTLRMSRLLDPSKTPMHCDGHGLKPWGAMLGYEIETLDTIATRPKPGAMRTYKQDRSVVREGIPTLYCEGAECQNVSWKSKEYIPLPELWRDYPQRRAAIVKYATQDAAMSLDAYWHCRALLERRTW